MCNSLVRPHIFWCRARDSKGYFNDKMSDSERSEAKQSEQNLQNEIDKEIQKLVYYAESFDKTRNDVASLAKFKEEASDILESGKFPVHKWESNVEWLESNDMENPTKLLGHVWDKREESLEVTVPNYPEHEPITKRSILSHLGSIYDPLGVISPTLAEGKRIYRDVCNEKKCWNAEVKPQLKYQWLKWTKQLRNVKVPRSINKSNCRLKAKKSQRTKGPLTTEEIVDARDKWVRRVQSNDVPESLQSPGWKLIEDTTNGVLKCEGRIAGYQPTYLREGTFVNKLIAHVHNEMHLGVASTMSSIRENWWIPQLRSKVKKVIGNCNVCKVFSAKPFKAPATSQLPEFRTTPGRPFETTGVDFAGPLIYKVTKKGNVM